MATCLFPDGQTRELTPLDGTCFTDSELTGIVEGHFQWINLRDKGILAINADAYQIGDTKNETATALAQGYIPEETWIAGTALHVLPSPMIPTQVKGKPFVCLKTLYMFLFEAGEHKWEPPDVEIYFMHCADEAEAEAYFKEFPKGPTKGQVSIRFEPCPQGYQLANRFIEGKCVLEELDTV